MGRAIIISLFTFPITILIIVAVLVLLKPPTKNAATAQAQGADPQLQKVVVKKVISHDIHLGNLNHVRHLVDSLLTVIDVFQDSTKHLTNRMDSLTKVIDNLKKEKAALNKEVLSWQKKYNLASGQQMEAKSIAKTLSSLKPKEMAKIVANLDDHAIILIYSQMSNSARSALMSALSSKRAADITRKMLKK